MSYGMDDPIAKKDLEKNQTIIQVTPESIPIGKKKKPPAVPTIVLASQGSTGSSHNLMKTRVESTKELKEHIKKTQNTQRTARDTPPVRRAGQKLNIDGDDQASTITAVADDFTGTRVKKSFLPQSIDTLAAKKLDQHKKMYTEADLWSFAESLSPILYEFGKKYNLEIEDLKLFAACMEELEINPQLITEHINASNNQPIQKGVLQQVIDRVLGDPHEQHLDNLHKQYAKMQREKPENYKALLLELMKTVADQTEGQQANRSTIADTHINLQNQEIANQVTQTRMAVAGLVVAVITAIPGWVTSMLQFFNPTNCTS